MEHELITPKTLRKYNFKIFYHRVYGIVWCLGNITKTITIRPNEEKYKNPYEFNEFYKIFSKDEKYIDDKIDLNKGWHFEGMNDFGLFTVYNVKYIDEIELILNAFKYPRLKK